MLWFRDMVILRLTKFQLRIVEDQGTTHQWGRKHLCLSAASLVLIKGDHFGTSMETLSLLIPEVMEDHLHQVQLEQAISMLWEPQSYSMMNNNKNA
jgi:hypothetical protein